MILKVSSSKLYELSTLQLVKRHTIWLTIIGILTVSFVVPVVTQAKDVVVSSPEERLEYLRNADTWQKPSWMDEDLNFDPAYDLRKLNNGSEVETLLNQNEVICQMTEALSKDYSGSGGTPKFYCLLMKKDKSGKLALVTNKKNKPQKIKVKYGEKNNEIIGEVAATRLLHAIGFGADRMFPVAKLKCYGCSADPWTLRALDSTTLSQPRIFSNVAIEQKLDAEEIKIENKTEGWGYSEYLNRRNLSRDQTIAREQIIERDALIVTATFIRHTDDKKANHRLVCTGKVSDDGKCLGSTLAFLQDVGFTFGGVIKSLNHRKVNLKAWSRAPIWMNEDNGRNCALNSGLGMHMGIISVTEEGRLLAGTLLKKFSEGEAGRNRVQTLFSTAGIERAGGTVAQWTQTFINKAEEILKPQLSDNQQTTRYSAYTRLRREERAQLPDIHCHRTADQALR